MPDFPGSPARRFRRCQRSSRRSSVRRWRSSRHLRQRRPGSTARRHRLRRCRCSARGETGRCARASGLGVARAAGRGGGDRPRRGPVVAPRHLSDCGDGGLRLGGGRGGVAAIKERGCGNETARSLLARRAATGAGERGLGVEDPNESSQVLGRHCVARLAPAALLLRRRRRDALDDDLEPRHWAASLGLGCLTCRTRAAVDIVGPSSCLEVGPEGLAIARREAQALRCGVEVGEDEPGARTRRGRSDRARAEGRGERMKRRRAGTRTRPRASISLTRVSQAT